MKQNSKAVNRLSLLTSLVSEPGIRALRLNHIVPLLCAVKNKVRCASIPGVDFYLKIVDLPSPPELHYHHHPHFIRKAKQKEILHVSPCTFILTLCSATVIWPHFPRVNWTCHIWFLENYGALLFTSFEEPEYTLPQPGRVTLNRQR